MPDGYTYTPLHPCSETLPESPVAHRDTRENIVRLEERLRLAHEEHLFGGDVTGHLERARRLLHAIRTDNDDMPHVADVGCGYAGEVDAETNTLWILWTCPRCGNDRREERHP